MPQSKSKKPILSQIEDTVESILRYITDRLPTTLQIIILPLVMLLAMLVVLPIAGIFFAIYPLFLFGSMLISPLIYIPYILVVSDEDGKSAPDEVLWGIYLWIAIILASIHPVLFLCALMCILGVLSNH
jgi:ABC-type multidrug transport system fused ATPase/permease subunit